MAEREDVEPGVVRCTFSSAEIADAMKNLLTDLEAFGVLEKLGLPLACYALVGLGALYFKANSREASPKEELHALVDKLWDLSEGD